MNKFALALAALVAAAPFPSFAQTGSPAAAAYGGDVPIDFSLSGPQIVQSCSSEIARYKQRRSNLERTAARHATFAGVVMPLENVRADFQDALAAELFLYSVASDPAVRAAAQKCVNRVSAVQSELDANPALYRAVLAASQSGTATTDAARKLTQLTLARLRRGGAALGLGKRMSLVDDEQQLTELETSYTSRLRASGSSIEISAADAKSLPADFLLSLRQTPDAGYVVPVDESRYARFLSNEADPQARWRFLTAYLQRGGEENVRTLARAIAVRNRIATLLGYPSWASFVLADRMAGSPARLRAVLDELNASITPSAQDELARLTERKRAVTGDPGAVLESWDQLYYANDILKAGALDQDAIRQYFPLDRTVQKTLDLYAKLFGIMFTRRSAPEAWSPDVLAYEVTSAGTGAVVGTLYLDLYSRPGKYPRFATYAIRPVRQVAQTLRPPVAAIVGNWPRPAEGATATLSHDDVVTFFHECGHAMADLLSTVPYESLNGYRWDFVEAPAEMLENWPWDRHILAELSSNVSTGKPLPSATIEKLLATRRSNDAIAWLTQVSLARVDLAYHSGGANVDTTAVWNRIFGGTPLPQVPAGSLPQAGLANLMNGYAVGYYGFVWSKVYAQDMFSAFEAGGLEDPALGMRYRTDIFEPSRMYEPDVLVQRFLGRTMSTGSFLRDLQSAPARTAGR
jgi:thimet oligopeptidase